MMKWMIGTCGKFKAKNTLEHVARWGKLNLPLCDSVYGTPYHSKQAQLASCTEHPDPPAVGPSKWAKAEHVAKLLLSRIYIWSGQRKCASIFWQGEINHSLQSQIQHASPCFGAPLAQVCSRIKAERLPNFKNQQVFQILRQIFLIKSISNIP